MYNSLFSIIDYLLFSVLTISVLYLLFFSLMSKRKIHRNYPTVSKKHRFVVLFPAYKEDAVIVNSVESFLRQDYPNDLYDVIVISDHMLAETNTAIEKLLANVLEVKFEQSSKAKALNFAIDSLDASRYDVVVILDADNIVEKDFLDKLNNTYSAGVKAIQAHRIAKNSNTDTALLDAASEEINNSIFRKGQVNSGFSAALSGSGMAFDYNWFAQNIKKVTSSGEDKEIEALLLKQKVFIEYLDDTIVMDEKIQNSNSFYNQRQRWLAAQYAILMKVIKDMPQAFMERNFDYCNKIVQWMLLPRVILLGSITLLALLLSLLNIYASIKWWGLLFLLIITFFIAIPNKLLNKSLCKAIIKVPGLFVLMFMNLFRLKGANQKFNRTEHTH